MKIKAIAVLILLFVVQYATFFFFGRSSLSYHYFDTIENYNYHKGELGILDNNYSSEVKENIEARLLERYNSVVFIKDSVEYFSKYRVDKAEKRWGLSFEIERRYLFFATVSEKNGTLYYGEEWESDYFWFFGFWIRYEHSCISQS